YKSRKENEKLNNFIFRPRDVVDVLIPLKPDEDTIIAAFLYDLVDSGRLYLREIEEEYGEGVVGLLEGLQILKSIRVVRYQSADKVDLLRKLFLVMAKDIRVLVVLLSVRVVQMDLLSKLPKDCAGAFATEVLEIFVPIASRLGVYRFKTILEDRTFGCLNPEGYKKVADQVDSIGKKKMEYIAKVSKILEDFYREHGFVNVRVSGRTKGFYSIHNKMLSKGLNSIDGVYDVFAFRVIVPTEYLLSMEEDVSKLYEALGLLHSRWKPIASRFKDFVAVPKPNGYRSLHTTVLGLSDGDIVFPVEVQIRSEDMHDEAEYGIASHWLYKDTRGKGLAMLKSHAEWLKNLAILHSDMSGDEKVLESMKLDLFGDRIYVLTPKGEVKELPAGSTPLDFAYFVHTEIGHRCVLAKVNGKPTPLSAELNNGDTVEIVMKKDAVPKLEWVGIVKTSQAKIKIKNWFASQDKGKHAKIGREQLNTQLIRFGKPLLTPSLSILKNYGGKRLTLQERERVLEEIGKGSQTASNIIKKIYKLEDLLVGEKEKLLKKKDKKAAVVSSRIEDNILLGGIAGTKVRLAKCCVPSYGDEIIGYVSALNDSATIHKKSCMLLERLNSDRKIPAEFKTDFVDRKRGAYRISVRIDADERVGLLGDIGSTIAANGVNIFSHVSVGSDKKDGATKITLVVDVENLEQLEKVLDSLERVNGIRTVTKVT
ncbi:MAG: RelA/SpoT family protein, partial [Nanoarchaeota archaeon]|nr:RelA/SpoT family protein [Nanoarchaeota archaeon]